MKRVGRHPCHRYQHTVQQIGPGRRRTGLCVTLFDGFHKPTFRKRPNFISIGQPNQQQYILNLVDELVRVLSDVFAVPVDSF